MKYTAKIHRASLERELKRSGTFQTEITKCGVTPGKKRLATNVPKLVTCVSCRHTGQKRGRKPQPKPAYDDVLMANPVIRVWRFGDAPPIFQALSPHGGDEDWLALVPAALVTEYIGWLHSPGFAADGDVTGHPLDDGSVVYIGAHA